MSEALADENELNRRLVRLARLLLGERDAAATARLTLELLIAETEASRGFIVVREDGDFRQAFDVHYDRSALSNAERRFSRSMVRRAIETKEVLHSVDMASDPRFVSLESARLLRRRAAVVAPLLEGTEVHGVLYLERPATPGGFSPLAQRVLADASTMGGTLLCRALERDRLRRRSESLESDLLARHDFSGIVTQDRSMLALLQQVAQVAPSDATVLVGGETGTGKELIARALHVNSKRRTGPLVVVHCAAIPEALLDAELFGHRRGAFTGASADRSGRLASAHHGTLFLDEVAEIPPPVQAKLLRFLQEREIQPVGADRVDHVDVRVVAATHADLAERVKAKQFREDFYYRLRVVELHVPPLRERRGDIALLAAHFVDRHAGRALSLALSALRRLEAWDWPGNVRELDHVLERACLLANEGSIEVEHLTPELQGLPPSPSTNGFGDLSSEALNTARKEAVAEIEATFVRQLVEHHGGNISEAARAAGMRRSYLQKLLARHRS